jgi:hypothetical protein
MRVDVFACNEPEIEVDAETNRVLEQRMRTADEGLLVSAEEARRRIQQWLSNSATTETR